MNPVRAKSCVWSQGGRHIRAGNCPEQGSALAALGSTPRALPVLHMLADVGMCAAASDANPPVPCRPRIVIRA